MEAAVERLFSIFRIKTLENPILGKKVLKISGMHCEHCVKAVTEAINKIDGAAAKVDLSEKRGSGFL